MSYADGTNVSEERSRAEIQFLLEKYGADQFGYQNDRTTSLAKIAFRYKGVNFLFTVPMARPDDKKVRFTPSGKLRTQAQIQPLLVVENRRRWRSLKFAIKAMLVGVEDGIFDFGQVFSPYVVWGDGRTTWESLLPVIEESMKANGHLPRLGQLMLESK